MWNLGDFLPHHRTADEAGREAVVVSPAEVKEQYAEWLENIVTTMKLTDGLRN